MNIIVCKIFSCFLCLLTALIVKNSHILIGIYFIFLKKRPRPNLKGFQYQTWTSVKRSESSYQVNQNFTTFLQITGSNFNLKLCQRPKSYENVPKNHIWRGLWRARIKKLFPETIIYKIFETNSSFHVK